MAIPLSARSCKYEPGFRGAKGHGVYDALLLPRVQEMRCDVCDGDLKGYEGWVYRSADLYRSAERAKSAVGHTAIDIRRRTAAQGMFYLEESLTCPDGLGGELRVPGGVEPEVIAILDLARGQGLRLGHGRSKGMGRVSLEFREGPNPSYEQPPLLERIEGMQAKLRQTADHKEDAAFSVTFRSRTILLDDYLRFRSRVTLEDLGGGRADKLGALLGQFRPATRFTRTDWVHGWSSTTKLPKTPDLAVAAGACFLLVRRGRPLSPDETAVLCDGLEAVEASGVGERLTEGFGRVAFCDPFHWSQEYERGSVESETLSTNCVLH